MKIKDLPRIDRPREKLEKYGPERLSDSELLAILLRTGSEGVNVVELEESLTLRYTQGREALILFHSSTGSGYTLDGELVEPSRRPACPSVASA